MARQNSSRKDILFISSSSLFDNDTVALQGDVDVVEVVDFADDFADAAPLIPFVIESQMAHLLLKEDGRYVLEGRQAVCNLLQLCILEGDSSHGCSFFFLFFHGLFLFGWACPCRLWCLLSSVVVRHHYCRKCET